MEIDTIRMLEEYLIPTEICDCDNPEVKQKANELIEGTKTPKEAAISIFKFVRDNILFAGDKLYPVKASETLKKGTGFCVPKTNLQIALLRAVNIPARYHQLELDRNCLKNIVESLDNLPKTIWYHPTCECYLDEKWIACDGTFDKDLYEGICKKGILDKNLMPTIDWDGENDLYTFKSWLIKDRGTHNSYDAILKNAQEEWENIIKKGLNPMNIDKSKLDFNALFKMATKKSIRFTNKLRKIS